MRRRTFALCIMLLSSGMLLRSVALAQTSMEGGARVAALGGAGTALAGDGWGYANPASWATLAGRSLGFFATEAFGLEALRLGAAQYTEPFAFGTVALGARSFGFEDYRETHLNVGAARGFRLGTTRRFHLGLNLRYHRVAIPSYGSAGTVAVGLGWLVSVLPVLDVGFHATNFHNPKLGTDELARTLALGLAYAPHASVRVVADLYKDVRFPLSLRTGVEVRPIEALSLRAGAATRPARITTGVGFHLGRIVADVAAERHDVMGWSPAVAFGLQW